MRGPAGKCGRRYSKDFAQKLRRTVQRQSQNSGKRAKRISGCGPPEQIQPEMQELVARLRDSVRASTYPRLTIPTFGLSSKIPASGILRELSGASNAMLMLRRCSRRFLAFGDEQTANG